MTGRTSALLSLYLLLGTLLLVLFCSNASLVEAEVTEDYLDMIVERVVQIENGGAVSIYDNVTLSSGVGQHVGPLEHLQIGFPIHYRYNLVHFSAYDPAGRLQVTLDDSAGEAGFSWIEIAFRESVNVTEGTPYDFTLVYVFSGLVESNQTRFRVDFPAYPSLKTEATFCNVTVMFPVDATLASRSQGFLNRTLDSLQVLYNETSPLGSYANVSSWAEFTADDFLLLEVSEWRREIKIDGLGGLTATDLCQLANKADRKISSVTFVLPPNATGVSVQDVFGVYAKGSIEVEHYEEYVGVKVILREALGKEERAKLLIVYDLPFWKYVAQRGWQDYVLNVSLARPDSWVLKRFEATASLPEGAEFQSSSGTPYTVEKEGFLVRVQFAGENVTRFDELNVNVEYRYLILWASFRPTLWVGTAVAILGGVFFIRSMSRPEAVITVSLSSEVVAEFVDSYEEKRRLRSRAESLERQVQKGKISRRRYRLRKSALDGQLSRLQKDLSVLRTKIEAASRRHAEWMRQLQTAETEIETIDKDITRVEVRYRRREISAEARRRLLDEYNRIKEGAENRIAGILLRLREEIR